MITVGLINELGFISSSLNSKVEAELKIAGLAVLIKIEKETLTIIHENEVIWEEFLDKVIGNFGIESCHHIYLILLNKRTGQEYKHLIYKKA